MLRVARRCVIGLLAAWIGLLTLAASAQDMSAHIAAGQGFDAWRAMHPDRMPKLAESEAVDMVRTLGDAARFLPSDGRADLPTVSDACDRAQSAVVAYLAFGALQQGQLNLSTMADNAAIYQDELAVLQPFLARCTARQVPLAESVLRRMAPRTVAQLRLGGLRRGQAAILQLYASLATALSDDRMQPAYIEALLGALAEGAVAHARGLPVGSRAMPHDLAAREAAKAGPRQAAWRHIASAMADPRCEALCELAARNAN